MSPGTDWRYWVVFEGIVEATHEDAAIRAALDDVDAGKIPDVSVEPLNEGREGG